MNHLIFAIAWLAATPATAAPEPSKPVVAPIEVMIVGGFHMSNPGHDLHNVQVPDVLAPKAQTEITAIDAALARFHPTVVAAEWDAPIVAERYPKYLDGSLAPSHNEVVQLGFRLAKATGARMIGVDADGDFPYQPVLDYAKAHGEQSLLDQSDAGTQSMTQAETRLLAKPGGIAATLRYLNDPVEVKAAAAFYGELLKIGGGADQPGADLLTGWNRRNFLICANLIQAARPGDRMVVFFGAGHGLLLRRCIADTPGFKLVEPASYLPR
jgi:hypothetical protein